MRTLKCIVVSFSCWVIMGEVVSSGLSALCLQWLFVVASILLQGHIVGSVLQYLRILNVRLHIYLALKDCIE